MVRLGHLEEEESKWTPHNTRLALPWALMTPTRWTTSSISLRSRWAAIQGSSGVVSHDVIHSQHTDYHQKAPKGQ